MTITAGVPVTALDQPTRDPRDPIARFEQLFDAASFDLVHPADDTGVAVAGGLVGGTWTMAYATDARLLGGSLGQDGCARIVDAIATAVRMDAPVVAIWHCGGARLAEGVASLDGVGRVFAAIVQASGRVLQVSLVVGAAAGGAAYGSGLTDVVVMAPEGRLFVTGPDVIRSVTAEVVDQESLGGPLAHSRQSGVAHIAASSEAGAFADVREIIGHIADRRPFDPSVAGSVEDLATLLPARKQRAYDVRTLVLGLLDPAQDLGSAPFVELQEKWAPNVVVGFGRLGGRSVGIVANNPLRLGGCLESESAEKASRFVRLCDAFGVPLVVLVDVPGYLPGVDQEWGGVIRRGAKLLHAFAEATVPRVTLVTRKAFGGAYVAMNSKSLGATAVFAWPDAEIAVMGARSAVRILQRRTLAAATEDEREKLELRLAEEHERASGGLQRALGMGAVDAVIEPRDTRARIIEALAQAPQRRGEHRNIPL
jgi:acetyl-CoA/propionyl-CoA carboxylase carboxyl transferase subunit